MSIKTEIEAEKTKLLTELKSIEDKAKADLAALKDKIDLVPELESEIKTVETKIKAEVQKVEKWFVSHFKSQAQTAPVAVVEPSTNTTTVQTESTVTVQPAANTVGE